MLLSQELSAEDATERAGKRFAEAQRPEAGPMGLGTGLVSGSGPEEEEGPVGLEAGSVRRQVTPGASFPPPQVLRHVLTQAPRCAHGSPRLLEIGGSSCLPLKRAFYAPAAHLRRLPRCLHPPSAGHSSRHGSRCEQLR